MLITQRKLGETVYIGEGASRVTVTIVEIAPGRVRVGILAPKDVLILRSELVAANPPKPIEGEGGAA